MRRSVFCALLVTACLVSACAEPPNKEMDQAQGAIDAARAAGADQYAATEYAAATTALTQANDAVGERDYRMALNYALESREHAQNAAREAATNRARLRGEVERSMAEIAGLLAQANMRLAEAERARAPLQLLRETRQALTQVNTAVQEAGAALDAEDYAAAQPLLAGVRTRTETTIAALDAALTAQSSRRRR
jgi:hypothetical protein